jgi:DNA-binding PadR family transcriptional regulator
VLELAILGLLKEQELHGYELKKRVAETVGSGVSFGSLYPALNRLTSAGALRVVATDAALRNEARGSRGRKVYGITDRGEELFDEILAADTSSSEDERSFNLRLAFARHLPRDARIGMMERRRAFLLERLARTRVTIRTGWSRLDAYTRSLIEHGNEMTERDISWLDRLIERERSDGRPAAAPRPAAEDPGLEEWAASSAPTMPARPKVWAATPAAGINHGTPGPVVAAPVNQQPAPPAHQHGGNNS